MAKVSQILIHFRIGFLMVYREMIPSQNASRSAGTIPGVYLQIKY